MQDPPEPIRHGEWSQSALFFETPAEIFARLFRDLKPRTRLDGVHVEFRQFAEATSRIAWREGQLTVRLSDLFEGAPSPVLEALGHILIRRLFRMEVPRQYHHRYRLYLNRKEMRQKASLLRQVRGRKFVSGPRGEHLDLDPLFDRLNEQHFNGLMGKPQLGWSRGASRSMLGHYDPSHNAIIISRVFDDPRVPPLAVEYVMYHEMLHLRYPVEHNGVRRRVHTREFREAEKKFPRLEEAKLLLKKL